MRQHDETESAMQSDDVLERAVDELRRPLRVNATLFDARVMDEVLRAPSGWRGRLAELTRPRTISVSPLVAMAAGLLFAVSLAGSVLYVLPSREPAPTRVAARAVVGSPNSRAISMLAGSR